MEHFPNLLDLIYPWAKEPHESINLEAKLGRTIPVSFIS